MGRPPARRARKWLLALATTSSLVAVLLLGFVGEPENDPWLNRSPLWGPGDHFYSETEPIFLHSPLLIWRGRPHFESTKLTRVAGTEEHVLLNNYGLRDDDIPAEKPAGVVRILNVGDSSTFGLNLRDRADTYTDQLEELLNGEDAGGDGRRFDVVNAGVVGYSSLQVAQFLRFYLDELEPDVVTVYVGNNDPAPAGPDARRITARAGRLQNLVHSNWITLLVKKWMLSRSREARDEERREREELVRSARDGEVWNKDTYYRTLARVPPDEYERNLRDIVRTVRDAGARVILLKVPQNLVWPRMVTPDPDSALIPNDYWRAVCIETGYLFRARHGEPSGERPLLGDHPYLCLLPSDRLTERTEEALRRRLERASPSPRATHNLGVWEILTGRPGEAVGVLDRALSMARADGAATTDYQVGEILYHRGLARLSTGREDDGFRDLVEARRVFPFATSPDYLERFDRVVADLDVEWVDLPRAFAAADPRFRGSVLMHDWVHPNARGGAVIAEALAALLREKP